MTALSKGKIRPVILCGGAGTRLWPLSRQNFPKQFLPITSDESLLQLTAKRLSGDEFAPALIVSAEDQRHHISKQLQQAGVQVDAILLEPVARNTSAAAALAALWTQAKERDDLLLLMPSDHIIGDREAFIRAVEIGKAHAEGGAIVTFGATPTEPNTQYGYIEADKSEPSADGAFPIARFVEKPDARTAADYLASGRFYWNAGIFLANASTLISEMAAFLPDSLESISAAVAQSVTDGPFIRPEAAQFSRAENISIDNGIMERTARGVVVPVQMQWSDVGSWDTVWKVGEKDEAGNVIKGNVASTGTTDSLLRSDDGPMIAAIGLTQTAVIAVRDAVLVAPIERMSELKPLVEAIKAKEAARVATSPKVAQAWGFEEAVAAGEGFQIRRMVIDPGARTDEVSSKKGPKHWIVLQGSAELRIAGAMSALQPNQSVVIPAGTRHSAANVGEGLLELIEVQCEQREPG